MRLGPTEVILVLFLLALYFLPLIIAVARHHRNTLAIFLVNFFTGWTLIGWIIALVWSATKSPQLEVQNVNPNTIVQPNILPKSVGDQSTSYCSKCGLQLNQTMEFCPKCGTKKAVS
jgi:hypothetical protein